MPGLQLKMQNKQNHLVLFFKFPFLNLCPLTVLRSTENSPKKEEEDKLLLSHSHKPVSFSRLCQKPKPRLAKHSARGVYTRAIHTLKPLWVKACHCPQEVGFGKTGLHPPCESLERKGRLRKSPYWWGFCIQSPTTGRKDPESFNLSPQKILFWVIKNCQSTPLPAANPLRTYCYYQESQANFPQIKQWGSAKKKEKRKN